MTQTTRSDLATLAQRWLATWVDRFPEVNTYEIPTMLPALPALAVHDEIVMQSPTSEQLTKWTDRMSAIVAGDVKPQTPLTKLLCRWCIAGRYLRQASGAYRCEQCNEPWQPQPRLHRDNLNAVLGLDGGWDAPAYRQPPRVVTHWTPPPDTPMMDAFSTHVARLLSQATQIPLHILLGTQPADWRGTSTVMMDTLTDTYLERGD